MPRPPNTPLRSLLTMVAEKFVNLRYLQLENSKEVGDEYLVSLGKLPTLKCLSLSFSPCYSYYPGTIADMALWFLGSLSALRELHLSYCDNIADAGVRHLRQLTSLTRLSLFYCCEISDECLRHLGFMALRDLNLDFCKNITDMGCNTWEH